MVQPPVPGRAPHDRPPNGYPVHPSARFPGRPPQPERRSIFGDRAAMVIPMLWIAGILVGGVAVLMIVMTITFAVKPQHASNTGPAPVIGATSAATQSGTYTPPGSSTPAIPFAATPTTPVAPPTPCFPLQPGC